MSTPSSGISSNETLTNSININTAEMKLPLWQANLWFLVLWGMMFFDIVDRFALAACLPYIKKAYTLTDTQAGFLNSMFALSVAILSVPVSMIAYKWSRRKILAIMVAVWSIASWGTGLAKGYLSLCWARFSVGCGEAGYAPIAYSFVSYWYPQKMRGLMLGFLQVANQIASTVGLMLCGWIAYTYGWQSCFGILSIPGLILAVLGWFMPDFKNKVYAQVDKIEQTDTAKPKVGMKEAWAYTLGTPSVIAALLMTGFVLIASTAVSIWGVTLCTRTFGMDVKQAATFIGFVGLVSIVLPIFMGKIADQLITKRKDGRLIASIISGCGFLLAALVFTKDCIYSKDLVVAFISYVFLKGFLIAATANSAAIINDVVPPHYRTISNSLIPISNQGIGGMTGPLLCGILSDKFGINLAFMYVIAIGFALQILATLVCKMFLTRDLEKMERVGVFSLERE
ncbi:MFS transporter [Desulfitobacterium sp. AusDCA]|uniref:MFS transporter n=1 Tax=Desulfitobacterium sp. AusDCA TaxID=3240383 RepID=UPI003DA6FF0D